MAGRAACTGPVIIQPDETKPRTGQRVARGELPNGTRRVAHGSEVGKGWGCEEGRRVGRGGG